MTDYKTEQEKFWSGDFGSEYTERNAGAGLVAGNTAMFAQILHRTVGIRSVLEFGPNQGLNLVALHTLLPGAELSGVEINRHAAETLAKLGYVKVYEDSMLEFSPDYTRDLILSKGVLIHINPESLPKAYETLYQSSSRYICVAEYYNPVPIAINYRGYSDRLFKRDFAGEMMDMFPDLQLIDYGFIYHRDHNFPADDINWFLLSK